MKKLPLHRRPFFAKRILEIGGGHAPYCGVTHAVDKFPTSNEQRAGDLKLATDAIFKEGHLEAIPFESDNPFDFVYLSHVLEHTNDPAQAIAELNRVARKGYIATPSPLREQIACPYPFAGTADFHTYFCWRANDSHSVHVIKKTAERLGEFCDCENGRIARRFFKLQRENGIELQPLMPTLSKESRFYFRAPLKVVGHQSFTEACSGGACAYRSVESIKLWTSPLLRWTNGRFSKLKRLTS